MQLIGTLKWLHTVVYTAIMHLYGKYKVKYLK